MYILFAIVISVIIVRLLYRLPAAKKLLIGVVSAGLLFIVAFLFFPKERILEKAGHHQIPDRCDGDAG